MATAVLDLLTFKGTRKPRRLELGCSREDNNKAARVLGASPVKGNMFTYPPDEVVVLVLKHLFGEDLVITPDCEVWFLSQQNHAKLMCDIQIREDENINLKFGADLKPYQRVAVKFGTCVKRGIFADDRGLGKTLEAIGVCEEAGLKKNLVTSPGYLKYGWERELKRWVPESEYCLIEGERKERTERLDYAIRNPKCKYTIVNYEMIRESEKIGGYPQILKASWDMAMFDEAHRLKGRDSQWTKGAKKLSTEYLLELTGNPIANSPDEVWQLLNILDPNRFTSYWAFVEYFCTCIDGFYGREIVGINKQHLAQLQFVLQPYMIRRLKEEVAPWLPRKIPHLIEVKLSGKQKSFYKLAEKQMVLELVNGGFDIIDTQVALNIRLAQALANPAILGGANESVVEDTVLELLKDLLSGGEQKAIVGMWFIPAVELFRERLLKAKIKCFVVTGEVAGKRRDAVVESFKNCLEPCVLLGTIKAMSEGINVDECDNVIFADKSWVPLDNEQFEDRVHRLTSSRCKNYYHIVVKDSISEDKEEVLKRKTDMITEVLCMKAVAEKLLERTRK